MKGPIYGAYYLIIYKSRVVLTILHLLKSQKVVNPIDLDCGHGLL